jgi:DNA-binding transcriptional ArsR family regulator
MIMETSQDILVEASKESAVTEVFKALGDPVRWSIIAQLAAVGEIPCADLEKTLTVSKPTISYHARILQHAGLLAVRKEGRNYFYVLRREVLEEVQEVLLRLAPTPRLVRDESAAGEARAARRRAEQQAGAVGRTAGRRQRRARLSNDDEAVLLTW